MTKKAGSQWTKRVNTISINRLITTMITSTVATMIISSTPFTMIGLARQNYSSSLLSAHQFILVLLLLTNKKRSSSLWSWLLLMTGKLYKTCLVCHLETLRYVLILRIKSICFLTLHLVLTHLMLILSRASCVCSWLIKCQTFAISKSLALSIIPERPDLM